MTPTAAERIRAAGLDPQRMPRHVAIIMDGNGRWAKSRGWERILGHRRGAEAVRTATTECVALGIERLTLYAFSSENWERPQREIDALMKLLSDFLVNEKPTLDANKVSLAAIGHIERLPSAVRDLLHKTIADTAHHQAMTLSLALSYGGRDEIADAAKRIALAVAAGTLDPQTITADTVQAHTYAPTSGDVDVVIRTAGEYRLSNFMTWQSVYAEYVAVEAFWPDFDANILHQALREFQGRDRRFGRI